MKSTPLTRSIGDLAAHAGLPTHVLRHWESKGLLTPARVSGRRRYTDDDAYRVAAIQRGKAASLSLDQLRDIITATESGHRTEVLAAHRDQLHRRAAAIQRAIAMIDCVLSCDHEDFTRCPTFRSRVTGGDPPQTDR